MNPRPLGYEHYDVRLCRLAWSLVAALTSADGRQAFIPGLRRLPRLNPSRHVSCTNPVAESLAARTQMPSWDGADCELPSSAIQSDAQQAGVYFGEHEIRRSVRTSGQCGLNPYPQVSVLLVSSMDAIVRSGQSVREL